MIYPTTEALLFLAETASEFDHRQRSELRHKKPIQDCSANEDAFGIVHSILEMPFEQPPHKNGSPIEIGLLPLLYPKAALIDSIIIKARCGLQMAIIKMSSVCIVQKHEFNLGNSPRLGKGNFGTARGL